MKTVAFLVSFSLLVSTSAFSQNLSSFTGRATSVCSREELTTELSCPPPRTNRLARSSMSMSPFLKKFGLKKLGTDEKEEESKSVAVLDEREDECEVPEEQSETKRLMAQVKDAGLAGVISYALWELGFWTLSVPVCVFGYYEVTGHFPDFTNQDDLKKLGAEAFAFVNFARFAVPLRIGLALGTTPWIDKNVVEKFLRKDKLPECDDLEEP